VTMTVIALISDLSVTVRGHRASGAVHAFTNLNAD
jgi:hypothetical protein